MKLKTVMLLGALTALSCANASNEFRISKFYPLGGGCDIEALRETFITPNGYLDVAAGSPSVIVGIEITGAENVQQNEIVVGNTTIERANRNRPLVTSMEVNYRLSKRVGTTPRPYIQNMSLPFSDDGTIFGAFQLLSPELGQALVDDIDALPPSPGMAPSNTIEPEGFVDIHMDVEFKGVWSATRNSFTTGVLSYPVRAYRSNPVACAPGVNFVRYKADPNSTTTPPAAPDPDLCTYTGFTMIQLAQPPAPVCCDALSPGPGC